MTKLTNKTAIAYVLEHYPVPEEVRTKLESMIAQLEKRSSGTRKPTARQVENEGLKDLILDIVGSEPVTVTDIMKAHEAFAGLSNQKVASLVKQLKDAGHLDKTTIKGRSYFTRV